MRRALLLCFGALSVVAQARAATVSGVVTVQHTLTRKSVTPAVPVYARGVVPRLSTAEGDPLAAELGRVVLYLEGPALLNRTEGRGATATMTQQNREFSPALVVIPAGGAVTFPNADPIFHNVFSLSAPKTFDLGTYDRGQTRVVSFPKPGLVFVYCHLHPNMAGAILVTPSRFYAQPGRDGTYSLAAVPPGTYTLVAWHRSAGFFRKQITVDANGVTGADFLIPLPFTEGTEGNGGRR